MKHIRGFPPIAAVGSTVLVLGSMPGEASLRAGQYYAHPRNLFWPIIGELLGFDPGLSYAARVEKFAASGVALWDVLERCERRGSLDADIEPASAVPNDFTRFFAAHPGIGRVYFNGATAERFYRRYALPRVAPDSIAYERLPSTSPAHASLTRSQKLMAWRVVAEGAGKIACEGGRRRR